jgi:hypothetical protein
MSENKRKRVVVFFNDVLGTLNSDGTLGKPCEGAFKWLEEAVDFFDVSVYAEDTPSSELQKWFFDQGLDMSVYRELDWCDTPPSADYIIDYNVVDQLGGMPELRDLRVFNAVLGRSNGKGKESN